MNVPQIQIRQTLPLIGVNSTIPGKMNIKQPERVIEVQYHPADVEITFMYPRFGWMRRKCTMIWDSNRTRPGFKNIPRK